MTENIDIEERLIDLVAWYSNVSRLSVVEIFEAVKERGRTDSRLHYETFKLPKEERRKARSKTFQGIADAIASQWGEYLLNHGHK